MAQAPRAPGYQLLSPAFASGHIPFPLHGRHKWMFYKILYADRKPSASPDEFTFEVPAEHTSVTDIPSSSDYITLVSFLTPDNIIKHSTVIVRTLC